jgi:hypothetical protein
MRGRWRTQFVSRQCCRFTLALVTRSTSRIFSAWTTATSLFCASFHAARIAQVVPMITRRCTVSRFASTATTPARRGATTNEITTMITVTFHGFSNGCSAFAEVMPYLDLSVIARFAKKRGKLASKFIHAEMEGSESGKIFAGDRIVAWFTISDLNFFLNPRQSP